MGSELAKRKLTPDEIAFVLKRAAQGATQPTIARELDVHQGTVSKILKKHYVREAANLEPEQEKIRLLASLSSIAEAAMEGFRTSCRPSKRVRKRIKPGPPDENGQPTKIVETTIEIPAALGNPRYLETAMEASRLMYRIAGIELDAEQKHAGQQKAVPRLAPRPFSSEPPVISTNRDAQAAQAIVVPDLPTDKREDWVKDALNRNELRLSAESWEKIVLGLAPEVWTAVLPTLPMEVWEKLLPRMPPAFRVELLEEAKAMLLLEAEELRTQETGSAREPV